MTSALIAWSPMIARNQRSNQHRQADRHESSGCKVPKQGLPSDRQYCFHSIRNHTIVKWITEINKTTDAVRQIRINAGRPFFAEEHLENSLTVIKLLIPPS